MSARTTRSGFLGVLAIGVALGYAAARSGTEPFGAATEASQRGKATNARSYPSPVRANPHRDAYFPATEDLQPDEMRITSLGTAMPFQRPAQAAPCFLVELGNGDKFLFDIGTGAAERLAALQIPYNYLNKVFLGHLHADHMGDLPALWVGGTINNRTVPLEIWGPSGSEEQYGTKHAIEGLKQFYNWDIATRRGAFVAKGQELIVNEFDYRGENQVVYDRNGVTIRSFPAVHAFDGPVSFRLDWQGLSFVFSSDTFPNKWFLEYAKNASIVVHECFVTIDDLVNRMNFPVERALLVGAQVHTPPEAFGKVMSIVKPRMAVAYHFINDFDTAPNIQEGIRKTYDGPLTLAKDMLVWNVTKDKIRVREVVYNENVWTAPIVEKGDIDTSLRESESDFIKNGAADFSEVIKEVYDRTNKKYGTNVEPEVTK
ncbi:MAG: guanitoxin biosynthesis MBL fold metallo-hydrolase GntH [Planctomycetota bacterium]|jgi:ribonuclease Z